MIVHKVSQFKLLNQVCNHKMRVKQSNKKYTLRAIGLDYKVEKSLTGQLLLDLLVVVTKFMLYLTMPQNLP